jgi:ribosomal protein S18 acetylase RimI-like enzyme
MDAPMVPLAYGLPTPALDRPLSTGHTRNLLHHAFLLHSSVHRDYQRRGIGTGLVREAMALARNGGAEWLHVDYEDDLESFYRGCGFRPTPAGLLYLQQEDT